MCYGMVVIREYSQSNSEAAVLSVPALLSSAEHLGTKAPVVSWIERNGKALSSLCTRQTIVLDAAVATSEMRTEHTQCGEAAPHA